MEVKTGLGRVSLPLSLAMVGLLSMFLTSSAAAAPAIGKGGQISACYLVKGKAKGAMRVVPANRKCRRGERKLAWSVVGVAGPRGESGAPGERGQQGASGRAGDPGAGGADGPPGATIAALEGKVESLEELLEGVGAGDLDTVLAKLNGVTGSDLGELGGALGKLNGISHEELTDAVAALPELTTLTSALPTLEGSVTTLTSKVGTVEGLLEGVGAGDLTKVKSNVGLLCTQTGAVTDQVNSVGSVLNNLLGGLLGIPLVGNVLGGEKAPDPLVKVPCT